jgi:hypothetical protein
VTTTSRRPTRATVEGRAYLDLQNLARRQQRPTDELHQLYALEGFLARLARSPDADRLVLKGGVLLAAYDARRPTRDVDIQARAIAGDRDDVLQLVRGIAAGAIDDGLVFDTDTATADIIRDDDDYSGVRVTLTATLASRLPAVHGVRGEDHYRAATRHKGDGRQADWGSNYSIRSSVITPSRIGTMLATYRLSSATSRLCSRMKAVTPDSPSLSDPVATCPLQSVLSHSHRPPTRMRSRAARQQSG